MAAAKETPDSDVTQQQQSSSESEVDETALGVLLAEPRRPKSDPDPATIKEIESLPVLQLFKHHLKDFEVGGGGGGARESQMSPKTIQNVSVVCCTR
jgi:hypothetical protein